MREALAHMQQLLALGADYVTAVQDATLAFNVDQFALEEAWHIQHP